MHILLVNDDGIHAPGLHHLWEAVRSYADVTIVAPDSERSGAGTSITMHHPLRLQATPWARARARDTKAYCASGTPADCVKLALNEVLTTPPDLVISGINPGPNHGRNILYSGTVGAIIEATLHGIPGCAFSCTCDTVTDFDSTAKQVLPVIEFLKKYPMPQGTFLNVNYPSEMGASPKGFRFCRTGKGYWHTTPNRHTHPMGHPYFWLCGIPTDLPEEANSDVKLLKEGYMVATPVSVQDFTCEATLASHADPFAEHFSNLPKSCV